MFRFYDPKMHTQNAAEMVMSQDPVPLQKVVDKRPGVYLFSYLGMNPRYADIRGLDNYIYAGSSTGNFGARICKHLRSLVQVHEFDPDDLNPVDVYMRCLALPRDNVRAVEDLLIETHCIRWNQPEFLGFGNNNSPRVGSRASNWDIIHPGRPWALNLNRPCDSAAAVQAKLATRAVRDRLRPPIFRLFGPKER